MLPCGVYSGLIRGSSEAGGISIFDGRFAIAAACSVEQRGGIGVTVNGMRWPVAPRYEKFRMEPAAAKRQSVKAKDIQKQCATKLAMNESWTRQ
jgi:hypothetical protein